MSKKKLKFEEALAKLEAIAEQIESGEIGLEASIDKYEEGMGLVARCRDILSQAEQRIQKLQENAEGELKKTPFTPPAGGSFEGETDGQAAPGS